MDNSQTNIIYDTIIIGATSDGIITAKYLTKHLSEKVLLVSSKFYNESQLTDLLTVTETITLLTYNHGLFTAIAANGATYCAKSAILATGTTPKTINLKTNNLFYNINKLDNNRYQPLVIIGDTQDAVCGAIKLAKKYPYIYICSKSAEIKCSADIENKLNSLDNVIVLPLSTIVNCKNDKNGNLTEVQLDTYDTIKCGSILAYTPRKSDVPHTQRLLDFVDGKIAVNNHMETIKVPMLYAIGSCANGELKSGALRASKSIVSKLKRGD